MNAQRKAKKCRIKALKAWRAQRRCLQDFQRFFAAIPGNLERFRLAVGTLFEKAIEYACRCFRDMAEGFAAIGRAAQLVKDVAVAPQ